jgi:hypothetical protein
MEDDEEDSTIIRKLGSDADSLGTMPATDTQSNQLMALPSIDGGGCSSDGTVAINKVVDSGDHGKIQ